MKRSRLDKRISHTNDWLVRSRRRGWNARRSWDECEWWERAGWHAVRKEKGSHVCHIMGIVSSLGVWRQCRARSGTRDAYQIPRWAHWASITGALKHLTGSAFPEKSPVVLMGSRQRRGTIVDRLQRKVKW